MLAPDGPSEPSMHWSASRDWQNTYGMTAEGPKAPTAGRGGGAAAARGEAA